MATSILSEIYKEAAATSKGVVKMNNTLTKIYDDQEKGNKRQDKFFTELANQNRRKERDEKKRQSDLRNLVAGKKRQEKKEEADGFDLGDLLGNLTKIIPAIVGGLKLAFGLLKGLLVKGILGLVTGLISKIPKFKPKPKPKPNPKPKPKTKPRNRGGKKKPGKGGKQRPKGRGGKTKPRGKGGKVKPKTKAPKVKPKSKGFRPKTKPKVKPKSPGSVVKPGGGLGATIKGGLTGAATLGIGIGAEYLIGLGFSQVERMQVESKALQYAEASQEEKEALRKKAEDIVSKTKEYIESGSPAYWAQKTSYLGGEIPAEQQYRLFTQTVYYYDTIDNGELIQYEQEVEPQKLQRGGGVFDVPGHGQGDQVPMMLPAGSFVLNRVASQEMFARGGSPSGMVPTLLEPGEKVFMPGDPLMDVAMAFNSTFSRFQKGGMVGQPKTDTSTEKETDRGANKLEGKGGGPAVISVGKMLLGEGFTVAEHPNFQKHEGFRPKGDARVGGHSKGSLHYKNLAIDVTDWREGNWQGRTADLAERMYQQRQQLNLTQIIHDPWGAWFAGESSKGPGIGGHDTHLHLGFAKGPASDKGFVGAGTKDTAERAQDDKTDKKSEGGGGMLSGLTDSISGMFGGLFGEMGGITGALGDIFGGITESMKGVFGQIKEQMNSPEIQGVMSDIKNEMGKVMAEIGNQKAVKPKLSASSQPIAGAMQAIKDAMNPDDQETPTIVQVVPGGSQTQQSTVSGSANQNLPPGLSVRCSSWAAADYRNDRSLNCETL